MILSFETNAGVSENIWCSIQYLYAESYNPNKKQSVSRRRRVNLFSRCSCPGDGVFCHPQVGEDKTRPEAECAHHLGDGVSGFLKGLENAHRKAAEARDVFWSESGSDAATVLIIVPIDDVMHALDGPMPSVDGQHPLR